MVATDGHRLAQVENHNIPSDSPDFVDFALQQFFSPGKPGGASGVSTLGNIGTSSTNVIGLTNAFNTAQNLVNLNYGSGTPGTAGNSIGEVSPTGTPLAQGLTSVVTGTSSALFGPRSLAIDPIGNIWVGDYQSSTGTVGQISEYTVGGSSYAFPTTDPGVDSIAIDGAGNVFLSTYGNGTGGSASGDFEVVPAGSANGTTATQLAPTTTFTYNSVYGQAAIDGYGNTWVGDGETAIFQFVCSRPSTAPYAPTSAASCTSNPSTAYTTGSDAPQAVSVDGSNNIFAGVYTQALIKIPATSTAAPGAGTGFAAAGTGGLANAFKSLFDGKGNYWVVNESSSKGSVTEITSGGAAVSPAASTTGNVTAGGFSAANVTSGAHAYGTAYGLAIDPSGNVWVGNGSSTGTSFFEMVGQAAPMITPISKNLPAIPGGSSSANTFGTRP